MLRTFGRGGTILRGRAAICINSNNFCSLELLNGCKGLLKGVKYKDLCDQVYYSSHIKTDEVHFDGMDMNTAFEKDNKALINTNDLYLRSIHSPTCIREDLKTALLANLNSRGNFACFLLDGKSTAKSKMLESLKLGRDLGIQLFYPQLKAGSTELRAAGNQLRKKKLLHVDMRRNQNDPSDIVEGLINAIKADLKGEVIPDSTISAVKAFSAALDVDPISFGVGSDVYRNKAIDLLFAYNREDCKSVPIDKQVENCLQQYKEFARVDRDPESTLTIVIDEAHLAFPALGADYTSNERMKQDALSVLNYLATITKTKQMNVIMITSQHALPYQLAAFGFNLDNIKNFIYGGDELPPNEKYKLLTEEWKLGQHLAIYLIDRFGGQVLDIISALNSFSVGKVFLGICNGESVLKVLQDPDLIVEERARVRVILNDLVEKGYHGLHKNIDIATDKVCILLSRHNIGSVARKESAIVCGLPSSAWVDGGNFDSLIIPDRQSLRLVIAEHLQRDAKMQADTREATV